MPNGRGKSKNHQPKSVFTGSSSVESRKDSQQPEPVVNLDLRVGVEIECLPEYLLSRKRWADLERDKVESNKRYKIIQDTLNQNMSNVKVSVDEPSGPGDKGNRVWTIKSDVTVQGKSHRDITCPIEIVSPILHDHHRLDGDQWTSDVDEIFSALDARGGVDTNTSCGTHVHMSPKNGAWKLADLQKLACCIVYFERAFEALYPEARRPWFNATHPEWLNSYKEEATKNERAKYAKANHADNWKLRGLSYASVVDLICKSKSLDDIVRCVNPPPKTVDGPQVDRGPISYDRYYAWNFRNLVYTEGKPTPSGSVEYRRPPGVDRANECITWVRIAIAFVRATMLIENPRWPFLAARHEPENVHVKELRDFLKLGIPKGADEVEYFGQIFRDRWSNIEVIPVSERYPEWFKREFEAPEREDWE